MAMNQWPVNQQINNQWLLIWAMCFIMSYMLPVAWHSTAPLPPSPLSPRKYNIRVEDIMVRDIRYITLNCCYRDLHNVLLAGKLKTLALVESAGETRTHTCTHTEELKAGLETCFCSSRSRPMPMSRLEWIRLSLEMVSEDKSCVWNWIAKY